MLQIVFTIATEMFRGKALSLSHHMLATMIDSLS